MIGKQQKLLQRILPLVLFGTLWYLLIKHLSVRWAINPQYSFGWFVPVISAYLFLIRWRTRPRVEFAHSAVAKWFFCAAGFALLPTWLVEQPNPDWQLISWLLAFEIVALSLCAIYFVGGRSWYRGRAPQESEAALRRQMEGIRPSNPWSMASPDSAVFSFGPAKRWE